MGSPIDSKVIPYPGDMGGYEDKVIMAAGTFTQGSTIELSCDGPIRPPYIAYMQGGLTNENRKMGILKAIEVQGENAKRMTAEEYLRGNQIEKGTILT